MAVSRERIEELRVLHSEIQAQCLTIDEKYSLTPLEPSLDMPPSLNLEKLEYVPKTEEELRRLAAETVAAAMLAKEANARKAYDKALSDGTARKDKLIEQAELDNQKVLNDLTIQKEEIRRKVADNGLYFSNVAEKYCRIADADFATRTQRIYDELNGELKYESQLITAAEQRLTDTLAALETEREAREQKAYNDLVEQEEKQRLSIEKYNNSLEEKEQKYQASRAKAYDNALRAEQNRVLKNAQLYAELGEVGYRDMIIREKYQVCTDAFTPLTMQEGIVMLGFDSFYRTALGDSYETFKYWVEHSLRASA